jgi:hypothetical protein
MVNRHFLLIVLAVVLQAIIFLSLLIPFALPRGEVWQAGAFLSFFASFL